MGLFRRSLLIVPLALGIVDADLGSRASASVLCAVRHKALVVRDVCKPREETITPDHQLELGMGGAEGPSGPRGPAVHELKVLDAVGHQVGLVIGGTDPYTGTV